MTEKSRPKPDVRALVAALSKAGAALVEREIVAPVLPGGAIRTRADGLVYTFAVRGAFVGWGRFQPTGEREAVLLGEALPWQRGGYLEQLPALRVVLLWPAMESASLTQAGAWWALPFNDSDAHQRFGIGGAPLPVYLCDPVGGAERFERVIARVDGNTLWFDSPDPLADPTHAEWLRDAAGTDDGTPILPGLAGSERLALVYARIHTLETATAAEIAQRLAQAGGVAGLREERRVAAEQHTLEGRLRRALAKADATLYSVSQTRNPDGSPATLVVEWGIAGEDQRRRYRSLVAPDTNVVSSGICLSGRDRDFDLTSLVSVMTDRDRR